MRPLGWTLIQSNSGVLRRWENWDTHRDTRGTLTEERPGEDTDGRQPSTSQAERPREKPNLPNTVILDLRLEELSGKKIVVKATSWVIFCYGSPDKLTHVPSWNHCAFPRHAPFLAYSLLADQWLFLLRHPLHVISPQEPLILILQ